jgi:PAS domain S-box-containing protein
MMMASSSTTTRPIAILGSEQEPPGWVGEVGAKPTRVSAPVLPEAVRRAAQDAPCAVLDGTGSATLELVRQLHAEDPALQIAIVAAPPELARVRRAMMFTPGIGEVWLVQDVEPKMLERAARVTQQRRTYRTTRSHLKRDLADIEPHSARRAVLSDAYLATLLAVLPNPVLSTDDTGRILSWSAAAEEVLGYSRSEAIGAHAARLLTPRDAQSFARLLKASSSPERGEIDFQRKNGDVGVARVAVAPVEAGERTIRAVFLQDVTEERRAQQELESHATRLTRKAKELQRSQLELEKVNRDLRLANEALAERGEEAEQARAIADKSRLEAEDANRAKSDFLATMSHEMRTPINAIMGYADLLEMGTGGPVTDNQKAKLARITASSRHLLTLVEEVLDLAKIEAGRLDVEAGPARVKDAVSAALAMVGPLAAQRGIEIRNHAAEDPNASYVGDEDRVRQILVNLFSNSTKFTEAGGRITITCDTMPDTDREASGTPWTRIHVTDTGIGIAPEQLERIFGAFEQVEAGRTRTRGGTGLGLTISLRLARLMGGDLTLESEPGEGSTFTLWLPSETTILAPLEGPVLAEMLGPEKLPRGLADVGTAIQVEARSILDRITKRLRDELPVTVEVASSDLEDHALSFLADVGHALIALGEGGVGSERLLRDGGEIQRVVAELHGRQRAQLGWPEGALRQELEIVREELGGEARRRAPDATDVADILRVLGSFLDRSEQISILAWRRAVGHAHPKRR